MSYEVSLSRDDALPYLNALDEKSQRIVKENLGYLAEHPYPGSGKGDKRREIVNGEEIYRLHIGRTHTAFYVVVEDEKLVRVFDLMSIDEAHKRYD